MSLQKKGKSSAEKAEIICMKGRANQFQGQFCGMRRTFREKEECVMKIWGNKLVYATWDKLSLSPSVQVSFFWLKTKLISVVVS